jgi:hypothetical protein
MIRLEATCPSRNQEESIPVGYTVSQESIICVTSAFRLPTQKRPDPLP